MHDLYQEQLPAEPNMAAKHGRPAPAGRSSSSKTQEQKVIQDLETPQLRSDKTSELN